MRKFILLGACLGLSSAMADVTTKVDAQGYFTVVNDITYDYGYAGDYCGEESFELYMLTNAAEQLYDSDYRKKALAASSKGLIVKFVQTVATTDNSGNEKKSVQSILQFTFPKAGLAKVNKDFGLDSLARLMGGRICSKIPRDITYMDMSSLEKYFRVFRANGGKTQFNAKSWGTALPGAVKF